MSVALCCQPYHVTLNLHRLLILPCTLTLNRWLRLHLLNPLPQAHFCNFQRFQVAPFTFSVCLPFYTRLLLLYVAGCASAFFLTPLFPQIGRPLFPQGSILTLLLPFPPIENMALPRRIVKETQRLMSEPAPGISATPHEDNLRYFDVIIAGPAQSPFEGGLFHLELFLPEEYPMTPPKVRFITKIYHPNIDRLGRICLDILKDKWSPALQIRTVLISIQALLSEPNPDDPLANDVALHWKKDKDDAVNTARQWTQRYAME